MPSANKFLLAAIYQQDEDSVFSAGFSVATSSPNEKVSFKLLRISQKVLNLENHPQISSDLLLINQKILD